MAQLVEWSADDGGFQSIDPIASHASWMENFAWTRLPGVTLPEERVQLADTSKRPRLAGRAMRGYPGVGNFGGLHQRSDDEMERIWKAGVAETRDLLANNW